MYNKPKILVSRKISDGAEEILKQEFDVTLNLKDKPYPYEELIKLVNNYDGLISTSFDKLDKNFFDSLTGRLKVIGHVGVGYDNINTQSAKEKNIKVSNTPNVLNDAVAEITILLILASSRRIGECCLLSLEGVYFDDTDEDNGKQKLFQAFIEDDFLRAEFIYYL